MKRIIYLLMMLAVASCKKEMMNYEGMEGVYFSVRSGSAFVAPSIWPYRPYTNVEFIKQPAATTEYTANIKVTITGAVKDYDRWFKVQVVPDSTTAQAGVHYVPLAENYIIPANAIDGYIPVTLKRTNDLQTAGKKLVLQLMPNEYFGASFPEWKALPGLGEAIRGNDTAWDASIHTINVSDLWVQPLMWYGQTAAGTNKEAGNWGVFTRKKLELMCRLFNLTYEDFGSKETMPLVLVNLIKTEMARYLIDQFNAGTPVKEDDGRLMWVSSVPWTSLVGVPY